ncbi:arginine N-succinyltransferase [Aquabacterium sp. A7-Y]|uniref:arginine N-succinyltransferase n=1 Tax=Aquabacterium sp. A7-Y TaxID=1349605 RepID=UPI00223D9F13|nr:arginine N-succinyltransferase [Aquabacterium sp. A7-Y]MCW7539760.1 arginine N-succinyltransferase [Aquabacterium sp. A7-Y]
MNASSSRQAPGWRARLVRETDLPALIELTAQADPQVHTLPRQPAQIEAAVEHSIDCSARAVDVPGDESYLLVLEDPEGVLRGVAAIRATAGSAGTFFAYRNDVVHHASRDLRISNNVHVLNLCSDLTAHTQLLSFFVARERVPAAAAELLSRARLMLVAAGRERFASDFFVSLAGWTDADHTSPFWDALGRKFFGMDYLDVERKVSGARNRTLIVELMPHYPVYVPLLPDTARAVLGQMHPEAAVPFDILSAEGFEADRYVDIFDGGPILEAHGSKLRTLGAARSCVVEAAELPADAPGVLVSTEAPLAGFRCCRSPGLLKLDDGLLLAPPATLAALGLNSGQRVVVSPA